MAVVGSIVQGRNSIGEAPKVDGLGANRGNADLSGEGGDGSLGRSAGGLAAKQGAYSSFGDYANADGSRPKIVNQVVDAAQKSMQAVQSEDASSAKALVTELQNLNTTIGGEQNQLSTLLQQIVELLSQLLQPLDRGDADDMMQQLVQLLQQLMHMLASRDQSTTAG